jgi:hypothetical protein
MNPKRSIVQFERELEGHSGGISLYREGIDEFFLSHGYPRMYERLEQVRQDLDALGMYEQCRDALRQSEALVRHGPEHDEAAYLVLLNAIRSLMKASGAYEAMSHRWKAANDSS